MIRALTIHCTETDGRPEIDLDFLNVMARLDHRGDESKKCPHTQLFIPHHYLIMPDGKVVSARDDRTTGDHLKYVDCTGNLSICLVGGADSQGQPGDYYNPIQKTALRVLLNSLVSKYRIPLEHIKAAYAAQTDQAYPTGSPFFAVEPLVATLEGVPYGPTH